MFLLCFQLPLTYATHPDNHAHGSRFYCFLLLCGSDIFCTVDCLSRGWISTTRAFSVSPNEKCQCALVFSKQISTWRVKHSNTYPFITIYFYMRGYGQDIHVPSNVICFSFGLGSRAQIWCYQSVCWFITLTFILVLISHASIANLCPSIIISLINLTYILYFI